jgi:hypothetical protein
MNLYEAGALVTPNTGVDQREIMLDVAQRERIAVLVNRPLNAMPTKTSGVVRLADFPIEGDPVDFDRQCLVVGALEEEYRTAIASALQHGGQGIAPADFFTWAVELPRVRPQIQGLEHWEQIERQMIAPQVNQVMQVLSRNLTGTAAEQWENWRDRYVPQCCADSAKKPPNAVARKPPPYRRPSILCCPMRGEKNHYHEKRCGFWPAHRGLPVC